MLQALDLIKAKIPRCYKQLHFLKPFDNEQEFQPKIEVSNINYDIYLFEWKLNDKQHKSKH